METTKPVEDKDTDVKQPAPEQGQNVRDMSTAQLLNLKSQMHDEILKATLMAGNADKNLIVIDGELQQRVAEQPEKLQEKPDGSESK